MKTTGWLRGAPRQVVEAAGAAGRPAAGEAGGAAARQAQRVGIGADAHQGRAADRTPAVGGRWIRDGSACQAW